MLLSIAVVLAITVVTCSGHSSVVNTSFLNRAENIDHNVLKYSGIQDAPCNCVGGRCVKDEKTKKMVCQCRPGYGWYYRERLFFAPINECRECKCGSMGNKKYNCTYENPNFLFDGKKCICPENYKQESGQCKVIPDPCEPKPCVNGGICRRDREIYKCFCPVGFTGINCKKSINDVCKTDPCVNGGTCMKKKGAYPSYVCSCPKGYYGMRCEKTSPIKNPCSPNPCLNNGICGRGNSSDFTCFCHPNYKGFNCSIVENYKCDFEEDFCDVLTNFVDSNSTTFRLYHEVRNWTVQQGRKANTPFKDHSLESLNGHFAYLHLPRRRNVSLYGALQSPWLYSDYCTKFWYHVSLPSNKSNIEETFCVFTSGVNYFPISGNSRKDTWINSTFGQWNFFNFTEKLDGSKKAFQVDFGVLWWKLPSDGHVAIDDLEIARGNCSSHSLFDACYPSPCKNGGFCVNDRVYGYVCYCPDGYRGSNCELEADPCRSYPCYFGSTCKKLDGINYICVCPANATGKKCEKELGSACALAPCKNGGTCYDGPQGFVCECPKWYAGKTCTEDEWCVDGPGKKLCPKGACAFDHKNNIGYCKWSEQT